MELHVSQRFFLVEVNQHTENSRSSLSKHDFNINQKSVMKLHFLQK